MPAYANTCDPRLRAFEDVIPERRGNGERLFKAVLGGCVALALGLGLVLSSLDLPALIVGRDTARRASFLVEEIAPQPLEIVQETPAEPEDLTAMPELGQQESAPAIEAPQDVVETPPQENTPEPEPRRVYGVRKVFAKGLGSGAGGSAAGIISKRGNTLDKEPDDLVATEADLTGELAPISTVSKAPQLKSRVRPEYTEEMLANRVEGIVKARLLVDVDGRVKAVEILEDIGFGSRDVAAEAFRRLHFEPALRDDLPVAAWITMKYRFNFQD
jgi:TonB family protein